MKTYNGMFLLIMTSVKDKPMPHDFNGGIEAGRWWNDGDVI